MQARQVRPQSNGRAQKKSARGKGTKRAARMPEASANSGVIKGFFARRTVVGQLRGILGVLIQKEYDEKAPRKKRNGMSYEESQNKAALWKRWRFSWWRTMRVTRC